MRADWKEGSYPPEGGDCRKLVTLEQDGMIWVGIRAFNGTIWLNNGQRETAQIIAWDDLPAPAYSDGLVTMARAPTLRDLPRRAAR